MITKDNFYLSRKDLQYIESHLKTTYIRDALECLQSTLLLKCEHAAFRMNHDNDKYPVTLMYMPDAINKFKSKKWTLYDILNKFIVASRGLRDSTIHYEALNTFSYCMHSIRLKDNYLVNTIEQSLIEALKSVNVELVLENYKYSVNTKGDFLVMILNTRTNNLTQYKHNLDNVMLFFLDIMDFLYTVDAILGTCSFSEKFFTQFHSIVDYTRIVEYLPDFFKDGIKEYNYPVSNISDIPALCGDVSSLAYLDGRPAQILRNSHYDSNYILISYLSQLPASDIDLILSQGDNFPVKSEVKSFSSPSYCENQEDMCTLNSYLQTKHIRAIEVLNYIQSKENLSTLNLVTPPLTHFYTILNLSNPYSSVVLTANIISEFMQNLNPLTHIKYLEDLIHNYIPKFNQSIRYHLTNISPDLKSLLIGAIESQLLHPDLVDFFERSSDDENDQISNNTNAEVYKHTYDLLKSIRK